MQINFRDKINFGRALTIEEKKEYVEVRKKSVELVGQKDKSILIVHDPCLPQNSAENIGTGHLASEESGRFFDFMKTYLGINTVEVLPQGQLREDIKHKGLYRPYSSTSLSLGNHIIYPKLLTTPDYGSILEQKDIDNIVKENTTQSLIDNLDLSDTEKTYVNNETIANFKNIVKDDSPFEKALRKAYDKFETLNNSEFKERFETYKKENNDWLEPKGIYEVLKNKHNDNLPENWNDEIDKNLYNQDFDVELHKKRIDDIKTEKAKEIEYYKFKQFLADEHLVIGKKKLNEKGIKLFGDCPVGFSADEIWANPKAFKKEHKLIFNFTALDYEKLKDENSDSAKLLKRKVELFAKRYDGIRFDASWTYIKPKIKSDDKAFSIDLGESVQNMIAETVKKVKGQDFNLKNLIHEFDAHPDDFSVFKGDRITPPYRDIIKIYTSVNMNSEHKGWGYSDIMPYKTGGFVLGVGNHDTIPLRQIAELSDPIGRENMQPWIYKKSQQISILANILKLDAKKLVENPVEFVKAKFADPVAAKNSMVFYMDVFGKKERFNSHYNAKSTDYSYKISDKFEKDYHKAVQEGFGFNIMDSFEKIFKAKGYDETHKDLYTSVVKFRDILAEKGALTEEAANEAFNSVKNSKPEKTKFNKMNLFVGGAIALVCLMGAIVLGVGKGDKKSSSNN